MGASGAPEAESPLTRSVHVDTFYIDRTEVTMAEYRECVEAGECEAPGKYTQGESSDNCNDLEEEWDNHPVNCVRWFDAQNYCEWVDGGIKRLPTEAEWEKAARGTDGRVYPWGDAPEPSCHLAVMNDATAGGEGCGGGSTMEVGSRPWGVSPYGVHDMTGNVVEWVADWWSGAYDEEQLDNPTGPATGTLRVARGGSWPDRSPEYLRTTYRTNGNPDFSWWNMGFRCVMQP